MKTVLVTGGSGYIGSHTCLNLLESGYRIYVVDSLINSSFESIDRVNYYFKKKYKVEKNFIKFFKVDIRDSDKLGLVFDDALKNKNPIVSVIHFAGLKSVKESNKNPLKYWDFNVVGTLSLLKVMKAYKCNNFVFSSSATVYGEVQKSPLFENFEMQPSNTYGKTKSLIENILEDLHIRENWNIVALRYFNPIGAHHSGIIGENSILLKENIFPLICDVALNKQRSLLINGNNWDTRDGTCIRDYIHVEDLAFGHNFALKILEDNKKNYLRFNLGSGKGTSVLELVNTFEKVTKIKLHYEFTNKRDGDCAILFADCELAKRKLNWSTKKSIEDMCLDGWNWVKKNPNGYKKEISKLDLAIYNEF